MKPRHAWLLAAPLLWSASPARGQQTPPPPPAEKVLRICVVAGGRLAEVEAAFRPSTGDTFVIRDGLRLPFSAAYPDSSGYAGRKSWFRSGGPLRAGPWTYEKRDGPVLVSPTRLERWSMVEEVPVFREVGTADPWPEVLYLPVRPDCEFQRYGKRPPPG